MIKKYIKWLVTSVTLLISSIVHADCWTGKAEGVIQYSNGKAAIDFKATTMKDPHSNNEYKDWSCKASWTWIHVPYDRSDLASVIESQSIESRMISIATAALKTNTNIRICFNIDENKNCEATQVYDLGSY